MPIPIPSQDESKGAFISRCVSDGVMRDEFPESAQRVAVCHSQWDKKLRRKQKDRAKSAAGEPPSDPSE